MKKTSLLILSLLLWSCALPKWAGADDEFTPSPYAPISKGDAMLIRIENVGGGIPEYREIVDSDGDIKLPFLGMMSAVGKTKANLATEIAEAYLTARLSTNTAVQLRIVNHFDPPPDRDTLVRTQDPRRPTPIQSDTPLKP